MKRLAIIILLLILPLSDYIFADSFKIARNLQPIFIFAILGLGLNIITGFTGMLNLGIAAFMAIGAYSYAILTCDIYPFQVGFWLGCIFASIAGFFAGCFLAIPTTRLRGDYLAIVTLGFGEIVQDTLRNLESITKGTQGINPLPAPSILTYSFSAEDYRPWYYLFLGMLVVIVYANRKLLSSSIGRACRAVREDELAARCMGIDSAKIRLLAFGLGSSLAALAGALWACYLGSSGEPGNYDFQISIITLCLLIVGGIGSISGVLLGSFIVIGFNSIFLVKLSEFLTSQGLINTNNVFTQPNNWKFAIFGFALILMTRYRPNGLIPE